MTIGDCKTNGECAIGDCRREIDTLMEWTVHGFVLLVGLIDLVVTIITRFSYRVIFRCASE